MKRIPELDGVRGVAIVLVLVWHYIACQTSAPPGTTLWYISRALSLTWSGVDLFFVLSGFLIAGILLDNRQASNYFRVFYLRRVCRIFPIYFLLLAGFIALASSAAADDPAFDWLLKNPLPLWSYATFTQNIFMGLRGDFGAHWLGVTWSLAVEEQFYLFIPFLIYILPRRIFLAVVVLLIISAPVLRFIAPGFHACVVTPWRFDSVLAGALLAVLMRWPAFVELIERRRLALKLLLLLFALSACVVSEGFGPDQPSVARPLLLSATYSMFILLSLSGSNSKLRALLCRPTIVWFGTLSYGIYMYHQAVSGVLHATLRGDSPSIDTAEGAAVTLGALVLTLVIATLSFRYFERPITEYGRTFRYTS